MASRENQSYLIAVIVLVLISLALALIAFLGISKMNEYADSRDAAQAKADNFEKLLKANEARSEVLKSLMGVGETSLAEVPTQIDLLQSMANPISDATTKQSVQAIAADVTAVKAAYDKAVKSGSTDNQAISLLATIDNLNASLAKMNVEYRVKENQSVAEEQESQRKIKEMEAIVAKAEEEKKRAEADLNAEKEARLSDQAAHQAAMNQALESQRKANEDHEKVRDQLNQQITALTTEGTRLKESNEQLTLQKNELLREVFDRADGEVVNVFSDSGLVFVDLGRVHGLTPNQNFSIYDQSVTNFEKGKEKGSIEITRVMDNQAEGRITQESPTNPILPGDKVLTPTWDPGQRVRFALAGEFDLDGDGFSDYQQVKNMLERNGAEVACWHTETGEIQGQIDSTIRFLALGSYPSLGANFNPGIANAMKAMKSDAEANTIQIIDQQKLLQRMGVRAQAKMELLDRRVREGGFQPRTPPPAQPGPAAGGAAEGGE